MSTADSAGGRPEPSAVTVPTADGSMPAHLWRPAPGTASGAGVLVFQEIFGVTDYIRSRCADLAALGHTVLAPEIYWRLDDTDVDESHPDFLQHAMAIVGRLDWDLAVSDGQAAFAHLRGLPGVDRVGLLGFCFGGGLAWSVAAREDADALVSYYGSAIPQLLHLAPEIQTPSLHHFGLADTFIDQETVERIRDAVAGPTTRFETYEGAGHAFDNPHPVFHHAQASEAAWQVTIDFLAAHLAGG
jgi:carboxymethylenebutenolidase